MYNQSFGKTRWLVELEVFSEGGSIETKWNIRERSTIYGNRPMIRMQSRWSKWLDSAIREYQVLWSRRRLDSQRGEEIEDGIKWNTRL